MLSLPSAAASDLLLLFKVLIICLNRPREKDKDPAVLDLGRLKQAVLPFQELLSLDILWETFLFLAGILRCGG